MGLWLGADRLNMLRRLTLLALLLAVSGKPASADLSYLEKTVEGFRYLVVNGSFEKSDDIGEFRAAVIRHDPQALTFNSRGGMIIKALELGREIRRFDLATFQERDNSCMSACAYAFMGGSTRFAEPGSIGVHKAWFTKAMPEAKIAVSAVQEITASVIEYMGEMGVDTGLLGLALQIESDDIRFLTREEMLTYNVITDKSRIFKPKPVPPKIELVRPAPASKPPVRLRKPGTRSKTLPVPTPRPERDSGPARAQKMFVYEEQPGQRSVSAIEGSVVWSIVRESPGENLPPEQAIRARMEAPDAGIGATLTVRRNVNDSLPASHLIEIAFDLTEAFHARAIISINNLSMKETEEATGDSLIAVPAKITDSFFLIALNDLDTAVELNVSLLRDRDWIDLPLTYGTGNRALITLEKGETGRKVFDRVFEAWGGSPNDRAIECHLAFYKEGGNAPASGAIVHGYRYLGGDPCKTESWEAATPPETSWSGPGVWKQTPSGSWYKVTN